MQTIHLPKLMILSAQNARKLKTIQKNNYTLVKRIQKQRIENQLALRKTQKIIKLHNFSVKFIIISRKRTKAHFQLVRERYRILQEKSINNAKTLKIETPPRENH